MMNFTLTENLLATVGGKLLSGAKTVGGWGKSAVGGIASPMTDNLKHIFTNKPLTLAGVGGAGYATGEIMGNISTGQQYRDTLDAMKNEQDLINQRLAQNIYAQQQNSSAANKNADGGIMDFVSDHPWETAAGIGIPLALAAGYSLMNKNNNNTQNNMVNNQNGYRPGGY